MRFASFTLLSLLAVASAMPSSAATHPTRRTSASSAALSKRALGKHSLTSSKHASLSKHSAKPKVLGQRTIEDDRATQIQAALIHAGYLSGEPSGHWDSESEAAIGKMQGDNGWQTKLVPDSRALIKLGLGPAPPPAN